MHFAGCLPSNPETFHLQQTYKYCPCGDQVVFSMILCVDKWQANPIYVTAYSYFFGALFMGLASIYYAASQQFDKFIIPQIVSNMQIVL